MTGSLAHLERHRATVEWASRRIDEAVLLKEKLQSKVAVSTVLARFFIAALVEVVKEPEKLVPAVGGWLSYSRAVATVSFTVGLGLLLTAVYLYDQLAMPPAFWKLMPESRKPDPCNRGQFAHDYRLNGALYAYMLWTWTCIFTRALWCGVIGFLALLAPNYRSTPGRILIGLSIAAILGTVLVYRFSRPALGTD